MVAAVVLAGGAARRMGGRAKPTIAVGGRSMLTRVLDAASEANPRIVVGPTDLESSLPPGVRLVSEHPPGGGPVAALAAGLALIAAEDAGADHTGADQADADRMDADRMDADRMEAKNPEVREPEAKDTQAKDTGAERFVAVLAGDLPFLSRPVLRSLFAAATTEPCDAAVLADGDGRAQWLCGVWRLDRLRRRLSELAGKGDLAGVDTLGGLAGRGMGELAVSLHIHIHPVVVESDGAPPWFDCDTEDDLRQAEVWAGGDAG